MRALVVEDDGEDDEEEGAIELSFGCYSFPPHCSYGALSLGSVEVEQRGDMIS